MRVLALGDVHGCFDALQALEQFVPFTDDDLIVALGDYVDRGPDSYDVVEWLRLRSEQEKCVPLRGNHEIMMMGALKGQIPMRHWRQFGGDVALASYNRRGRTGTSDDIPVDHILFLDGALLPYYETQTHLFVHASMASDLPPEDQAEHDLYWERFDWMQPHMSGKKIICGHTAQRTGLPNNLGFAVCIDTWAYGDGWLTALDVATGTYWQANQAQQTRQGNLSELLK